jgi:hypothetical protein
LRLSLWRVKSGRHLRSRKKRNPDAAILGESGAFLTIS